MGDLVTLRPVTEDDLSWLVDLRNSPDGLGVHEWHGWADPQRRRRQWAETGLLGENGGTLTVLHGTERTGHISWRKVVTGQLASCWAIGIGLAPEFRGRGYGSEAQRLLARYLFAHTQVNRIEATTEITNVAEQRALEKAGFTREGILRGTTFRQGRWHDQVIYSVLRDEVDLEDTAGPTGPTPAVRSFQAGDVSAATAIVRGLPDYFTDDVPDAVERDAASHDAWVVTDAGTVAGFAIAARKSPGGAEILWLAVDAARRGRGHGTALLRHVMNQLAAAGVGVVAVKTLDRSAGYRPYEGTRAFWERNGFVQIDTIDPLPGWQPGSPAAIYAAAIRPTR